MKHICLYLHAHQPYRIRNFQIEDIGSNVSAFDATPIDRTSNREIIDKVSEKSYIPTNIKLIELLRKHPDLKLNLSITGTLVEQLELWRPDVLESFKELIRSGRVEIAAETYYHTLSFFYDLSEFEKEVEAHREMLKRVFNVEPNIFRNTELAYSNDLANWAGEAGYKAVLIEGWDKVLGWRSPNFLYRPISSNKTSLLLKNYRLSDDIAFRFSDKNWKEHPLTVDKFARWIDETYHGEIINLFMDYETFGEHQWDDSGIMDFLEHLPAALLRNGNRFVTMSEAVETLQPKDILDVAGVLSWADTERDLSAWVGNSMQRVALSSVYSLKDLVLSTKDIDLIHHWRKMLTSDHFYFMCTKWFNDGDVHAYFSPYQSPYDGHEFYMKALHDLRYRLLEKGGSLDG